MPETYALADSAAQLILSRTSLRPHIGVVLGSGLGGFADSLDESSRIPYAEIPAFPRSTAIGHAGKMVIGKANGVAVAAMQGRVHLYEGYSAQEVAFPTRVFGRMGIRAVILTNAAGGINLNYQQGALVLIRDHINLQGANPLPDSSSDKLPCARALGLFSAPGWVGLPILSPTRFALLTPTSPRSRDPPRSATPGRW